MKVKTFFVFRKHRFFFFFGKKSRNPRRIQSEAFFLFFTYKLKQFCEIGCGIKVKTAHWATAIAYQVFWATMLKRLRIPKLTIVYLIDFVGFND